jgi:hypothetical protein
MLDINILAAWGEFLGGIAVVASLIYLASQIRQNSRLLEATTSSMRTQNMAASSLALAQDPDVSRIFWEGLADLAALSEADQRRFVPLLSMTFSGFAEQYWANRAGFATSSGWEVQELGMRWYLEQPGAQQWWRDWSRIYPQDFRNYIDGLIREGEAAE